MFTPDESFEKIRAWEFIIDDRNILDSFTISELKTMYELTKDDIASNYYLLSRLSTLKIIDTKEIREALLKTFNLE